uniref:glucan 1,3-beta-glucosidase n=1 Tax=Pyrodinium bahamense TaxID=73915 RepID=A0A7S0FAG4_9DINO|mmetsp:Transcript_16806/g.46298  ORF Transcript_16806/g.46298 Transcript_16806/m.46298 type:complete len:786 (+) Transcript_16806:77-2434(+)
MEVAAVVGDAAHLLAEEGSGGDAAAAGCKPRGGHSPARKAYRLVTITLTTAMLLLLLLVALDIRTHMSAAHGPLADAAGGINVADVFLAAEAQQCCPANAGPTCHSKPCPEGTKCVSVSTGEEVGAPLCKPAAQLGTVKGYRSLDGDCAGGDLGSEPAGLELELGTCAEKCDADDGCTGFSYFAPWRRCIPKAAKACANPSSSTNWTFYEKEEKRVTVTDVVLEAARVLLGQGNATEPASKEHSGVQSPVDKNVPRLGSCTGGAGVQFPAPRVKVAQAALTKEQAWMATHWDGYHNGVNFGGMFVIEDWIFQRNDPPYDPSLLRLTANPGQPYDQHWWCSDMLKKGKQMAFRTFDCHVTKFVTDKDLDLLAEFGITTVRLPVGYWLFDDERLFPQDTWEVNMSGSPPYGVNPDGYITPGTLPLSDMVVRLHNRNIKVVIDMHANAGCSSPKQSHAGILCERGPSNLWAGLASDGICGNAVKRAKDGKTWTDVAWKIALERVVPWIKFIDGIAPGTIVAFEPVNEPDSPPMPDPFATKEALRNMTLALGKEVSSCLGSLASQVFVGISQGVNNANNYKGGDVAADYQEPGFASLRDTYVTDVHHYYAWTGCQENNQFMLKCACEANLPGGPYAGQDLVWAQFMQKDSMNRGWKMMVGEWSAGLGPAHSCHGSLPAAEEAQGLYQAQKWGFLSQYLAYKGKAGGGQSSFLGDFYWTVRMGYHWNVDPAVCSGPTETKDYKKYVNWDWSLLRLIELGLAKPLSELGLTPQTLQAEKSKICSGTFRVNC